VHCARTQCCTELADAGAALLAAADGISTSNGCAEVLALPAAAGELTPGMSNGVAGGGAACFSSRVITGFSQLPVIR
jgi:hypothetical protein